MTKNFNYDILFKTCIASVIVYRNKSCRYNVFKKCNKIQNRAMRFTTTNYVIITGHQNSILETSHNILNFNKKNAKLTMLEKL